MDVYNLVQRKQIIKWYHQEIPLRQIIERFYENYQSRPALKTIQRIINNFERLGCIMPNKHKRNRQPFVRQDERNLLICASVEQNPKISSLGISEQLDISKSTVCRVLKKNKYHAYRLQKTNEIFPEDEEQIMEFCENMMHICNQNANFIANILFTDESTFPLHGRHNPAVPRHWARENPHLTYNARTQYPQKLNVWAGLLGEHKIGPFFIDGNLTGEKYLNLLQNRIIPRLHELALNLDNIWFQQDGCPAHNSRVIREYLHNVFPNRVLSTWGTIRWPPRSPDLSPNDFFLWRYMKTKIYTFENDRPNNLAELQQKIINTFDDIPPAILQNAQRGFYDRLAYCFEATGRRFEHLMH